jgi:hypothetical protein
MTMADSPEIQALGERYKKANEKYAQIVGQTNDPAQHAKARAEIDAALDAITKARQKGTKAGAPAGTIAGSGPKSAWEMLTGK